MSKNSSTHSNMCTQQGSPRNDFVWGENNNDYTNVNMYLFVKPLSKINKYVDKAKQRA